MRSRLFSLFESAYSAGALQLARAVAPEVAPLLARLTPAQSTAIGLAFPSGGASLALLFDKGSARGSGHDLFASARPSSSPSSTRPSSTRPQQGADLFASIDRIEHGVQAAQQLASLFGSSSSSPSSPS